MAENKPFTVLWAGRLEKKPADEAFAFQSSFSVDCRLAFDDIQGSRAHAAMLGKQGIISAETARALDAELETIAAQISEGTLVPPQAADVEDIHSFIEGILTQRLGDAGRALHAGRSRNDQVALDIRLYLRRILPQIADETAQTMEALLKRAQEHTESPMPGYTHLQRAQCVTAGYWLCAWACALDRDRLRLQDALARMESCPLGSGALAASGLNLDRDATASALGFREPTLNAMDSVADRDFASETASALAIIMTHLSRFCEDIVLWASEEFGFVSLADEWSTGSSIMPQKKNPDFAELIRGKAGRTCGNLVTLLMIQKGLPYAYDKDLQEDKEALFDSLDTVLSCLRMFRGMVSSMEFNTGRMADACVGGFLEATDAAEYLVRRGLPFRNAHEVSALLVRDCIGAGKKRLTDLSLEEMRRRSPLFENDIYEALTPIACIKARNIPGGPAPEEVLSQITVLRSHLQ